MTIYEIDKAIINLVNEETGEVEDLTSFEALAMERDTKIKNIAMYCKNLLADAGAIKAEIDKLTSRKQSKERLAERLKELLQYALNGEKYECPECVVSYRKSKKVVVDDEESFINSAKDDFLTIKKSVNKTAIKNAIEAGEAVEGACIVESKNMLLR